MSEIRGVITAMATPFEPRGAVDEAAARQLAAHLVEHGSHGVVVAGSTGEAATLDDREHISLLRAVVDEVGERATVICGTGTNDTRHSVELTKAASAAGAEAALVVTPYYNKPNPAGILAHFEAIAAAVPDLPLIAYNIPSRVVINVAARAAGGDRPDRQRDRGQAGQQRRAAADRGHGAPRRQRRRLPGVPWSSAARAASSSPLIWSARRCGRCGMRRRPAIWPGRARSTAAWRSSTSVLGVTNPIPLKAGLEMTGLIPSGGLRLPLVEADAQQRAAMRAALDAVGIAVGS